MNAFGLSEGKEPNDRIQETRSNVYFEAFDPYSLRSMFQTLSPPRAKETWIAEYLPTSRPGFEV